jgi:hypothetical protein
VGQHFVQHHDVALERCGAESVAVDALIRAQVGQSNGHGGNRSPGRRLWCVSAGAAVMALHTAQVQPTVAVSGG